MTVVAPVVDRQTLALSKLVRGQKTSKKKKKKSKARSMPLMRSGGFGQNFRPTYSNYSKPSQVAPRFNTNNRPNALSMVAHRFITRSLEPSLKMTITTSKSF